MLRVGFQVYKGMAKTYIIRIQVQLGQVQSDTSCLGFRVSIVGNEIEHCM